MPTARAAPSRSKPTDWRKRFGDDKQPKRVVLDTDFAGIRAGSTLYVSTPGVIANYVAKIPPGEVREIRRLRNELARRNDADATCPVTTAIFLRVVAEAAWDDLQDGMTIDRVVPFWRAIEPGSPIAKRLRCGAEWIRAMREAEATGAAAGAATKPAYG
jgi:hypothetical protein